MILRITAFSLFLSLSPENYLVHLGPVPLSVLVTQPPLSEERALQLRLLVKGPIEEVFNSTELVGMVGAKWLVTELSARRHVVASLAAAAPAVVITLPRANIDNSAGAASLSVDVVSCEGKNH